jgi:Flp pilus assembly protein TadD
MPYVYAVALNSAVQPQQAIALLEQAHEAHPTDWNLLSGLAMIARDIGDISMAQQAAREMVAFRPADPQARALLQGLGDWQSLLPGAPAAR